MTEAEQTADDFTPSGAELVVADPTDETAVMTVLDKHDEAEIVREVQGRLSKRYLYDFPRDGSRLVDLSWPGVRECIREMNKRGTRIRIMPGSAEFEDVMLDLGDGDEPCIQVTMMGEDLSTGEVMYGTAAEPKWIKVKPATAKRRRDQGKSVSDDDKIPDAFARQKALGKAQRNTYKLFIPETLRATLIAQYKGDTEALKQIQAGAGAGELAELPPPLPADDERANELREKIRAVYQEIHEVNPTFILPAYFHSMFTRAEHSYERLEDFVAYLEQKRGEVTAP
jgi:hypothetical protein